MLQLSLTALSPPLAKNYNCNDSKIAGVEVGIEWNTQSQRLSPALKRPVGSYGGEEVLERSQLQEAVFESAWNEPRDMCLTLWTDSIFFLQASECWVGWNRSQDKERRREEEHSHSGMKMCSFAVKIARRSEVVRVFLPLSELARVKLHDLRQLPVLSTKAVFYNANLLHSISFLADVNLLLDTVKSITGKTE